MRPNIKLRGKNRKPVRPIAKTRSQTRRTETYNIPEKRPAKLAPWRPSGPCKGYAVRDGESFVTIAKDHQMDPWDLIYFNFQTYDSKEVNWYLREYVGCNVPTDNRKSWHFSNSASPGIIHVPRKKPFLTRAQKRCLKMDVFDRVFLLGRRGVLLKEIKKIRKHIHNVEQYAADDGDYTVQKEITRTTAILKALTTTIETIPLGAPTPTEVKTDLRTQATRISEYRAMIRRDNEALEELVRELQKVERLMKQCDKLKAAVASE